MPSKIKRQRKPADPVKLPLHSVWDNSIINHFYVRGSEVVPVHNGITTRFDIALKTVLDIRFSRETPTQKMQALKSYEDADLCQFFKYLKRVRTELSKSKAFAELESESPLIHRIEACQEYERQMQEKLADAMSAARKEFTKAAERIDQPAVSSAPNHYTVVEGRIKAQCINDLDHRIDKHCKRIAAIEASNKTARGRLAELGIYRVTRIDQDLEGLQRMQKQSTDAVIRAHAQQKFELSETITDCSKHQGDLHSKLLDALNTAEYRLNRALQDAERDSSVRVADSRLVYRTRSS